MWVRVCVLLGMIAAGENERAEYRALLNKHKMHAMDGLQLLGDTPQERLVEWIKAVKNNDVSSVKYMLEHYNLDPLETPSGSEPQYRSEEWKKIEARHLEKSTGLETPVRSDLDCAGCAMMEAVNTDNPEMISVLLKKVKVDNKRYHEQMLQVFTHSMDEGKLHALACLLKERSIPKTAPFDNVLLYAQRHRLFAPLYLLNKEKETPYFFQQHWKDVDVFVGEAEECEWRAQQSQYPATVYHKPSLEYDELWAPDHADPADTQQIHLLVWITNVKNGNVSRVKAMIKRDHLDPFERPSDDGKMTQQNCAMMEAVRKQDDGMIRALCQGCNVNLGGDQMLQVLRDGMHENTLFSLALILMMRPSTADSLRSYAADNGLWASEWLLALAQRQPGYLQEHWGKIGQVLDKAEGVAEEKGRSLNKRVARVHPRNAPVQVPESEDPRLAENRMWQMMVPEDPE